MYRFGKTLLYIYIYIYMYKGLRFVPKYKFSIIVVFNYISNIAACRVSC